MSKSEERWPLERVIEETRKGLKRLRGAELPGEYFDDSEEDLSFITQELLDAYWDDAKDKVQDNCAEEAIARGNVACY